MKKLYAKPIESKKPDTRSEHELNEEALYPPEPDTDAHNLKVTTMLELVQRNQELKERVRELEKIKKIKCPYCAKQYFLTPDGQAIADPYGGDA